MEELCYSPGTASKKKRADLWYQHKADPKPSTFVTKDEDHG